MRDALTPAVFLDRDGTIMEDTDYCSHPKDVRIFPGVLGALRRLKSQGFKIVIITNQSGIGRGLLYAGAGALILSLWQVTDISTLTLMERLYRALRAGKSKAASLREAQNAVLAENAELHPAFWGAFQLIGNAQPLSHMV